MKKRRFLIVFFNSAMIITAITLAVMFGILGYGRPLGFQHFSLYDFNYIHAAGQAWFNGLNPYVDGFPYPPNSSLLFIMLSLNDLHTSRITFIILNIFCIIVFSSLFIILYNKYNHSDEKQFILFDFKSSLLVSMAAGNVFIANILWTGQTTILFFTALVVSYYFYIRSYEIRSGFFLAIALIKPQLSYTLLIWLCLEKKWKTLVAAMISTVFLGAVPIYNRGLITSIFDWLTVLNNYVQSLHSEYLWVLFGLKPLLLEFGIRTNSIVIFACSIVTIIMIHHFYNNTNKLKIFAILMFVGLLLGQVGQYDALIMASILPYCMINIGNADHKKIALLVATFIILNFPRNILLLSDYRILFHHREIVAIIALSLLLLSRKEQPRIAT